MKSRLEDTYKIQTQRVGSGVGRTVEGKILNSIVRWTPSGYEMEAGLRHSEILLKQLDVEGLKPLSTPGVEEKDEEDGEDDNELSKAKASKYCGIAARINYLAADRPDPQYATKEVLPRDVDSHVRVEEAPCAHWSLSAWPAAYDLEV